MDASNYVIGAVLSQVQDGKERVIMYDSKGLVGSQTKWCTTRREVWAIVYFVTTHFSFYLQGREFTLRTEHFSLSWLKSCHDKSSDVLACWLYYLEPYRPYMKMSIEQVQNMLMRMLYQDLKQDRVQDWIAQIQVIKCLREFLVKLMTRQF